LEPLHADVADDELQVLGNLHVVDLEVNRILGDPTGCWRMNKS
jgi:hypothetical protein